MKRRQRFVGVLIGRERYHLIFYKIKFLNHHGCRIQSSFGHLETIVIDLVKFDNPFEVLYVSMLVFHYWGSLFGKFPAWGML